MSVIPIILSGGSGTRLWPLSSGEHPKQFLPLVSNKTMIQETLLRLKDLEIEAPIISCGESHRFMVAQQIGEVVDQVKSLKNKKPTIILEPVARNTAPAIACACLVAQENDRDAVVVVLPSDHVIRDVETFQNAVKKAIELAADGCLVTFGIVPTYPATGYGYVKGGEHFAHHIYKLDKFVEKPCLEKAHEYLQTGEYSWNSGMFVFKAKSFLSELEKFDFEMLSLSRKAYETASFETDFVRLNKDFYSFIQGNSIDYSVMEHTDKGMIIKLNAGWDDVGSWTALYDINNKDENLNVLKGNIVTLDTSSSYIRGGKRIIATIGLDNIVIVDSDDALLIAAKGKIQDVKKITEKINNMSSLTK